MPNPPTASPAGTRERVLAATLTLMRRSGYSGIGINEILAEGGAPKGSLYHFFPEGKRQIASEALNLYAAQVIALFDAALAAPGTPGQKVKRLLQVPAGRLEAANFALSCAAGAASLDLDADLEVVRRAVQRFFDGTMDLFAQRLGLPDRRRARSFAGLLLTAIEGAYIRGRAEHSTLAFKEAAAWLSELADREAAPR